MIFYICKNLRENILNSFQLIEETQVFREKLLFKVIKRDVTPKLYKQELCSRTLHISYDALYLKFHEGILNSFQHIEETLFCPRNSYLLMGYFAHSV